MVSIALAFIALVLAGFMAAMYWRKRAQAAESKVRVLEYEIKEKRLIHETMSKPLADLVSDSNKLYDNKKN